MFQLQIYMFIYLSIMRMRVFMSNPALEKAFYQRQTCTPLFRKTALRALLHGLSWACAFRSVSDCEYLLAL